MTALLAYLSPAEWIALTVAAYCLLAALGTAGWSFVAGKLKRRKPATAPEVVRAKYPPPVPAPLTPPFSQAVPSADWFFGIPAECLGDDAVRALCDDIERREFS